MKLISFINRCLNRHFDIMIALHISQIMMSLYVFLMMKYFPGDHIYDWNIKMLGLTSLLMNSSILVSVMVTTKRIFTWDCNLLKFNEIVKNFDWKIWITLYLILPAYNYIYFDSNLNLISLYYVAIYIILVGFCWYGLYLSLE